MSTKKLSAKQIAELEAGEDMALNKIITTREIRENGSLRIRHSYENCPTMAEQHSAHLTDLNYLIAKHTPDELAAYIAAKNIRRTEIIGHDFSTEPSLQEAKNIIYKSQQAYAALPKEIRESFKSHLEFLKFIDNPANAEKMVKLGLLTKKQIEEVQNMDKLVEPKTTATTTKNEAKEPKS